MWRDLNGKSAHVARGAAFDDLDDTYAEWFSRHRVGLALVRPDFHVFGSATEISAANQLVGALVDSLHLTRSSTR